jgi:DNA-directed RNA polymerase subunit RPC12/RpoP
MAKKTPPQRPPKVFDACPHCGKDLSPWEKVLLSVDRALTCKNCWYRILLDITHEGRSTSSDEQSQGKE